MEAAADLLEKYKKHPFAKGLLPFRPTLRSLESPFAKIYAKQDGRQRWVICEKATGNPALFSHAAAIAQTDPIETGNYVPTGEAIPNGLEAKNVQRRANSKCLYTYVFDSFSDVSMYEGQWILDDYMRTVTGFNPGEVPRRAYLSGQEEKYRTRFWMQTPMFLRLGPNEDQPVAPGHLHQWVVEAHRGSKVFRANPDRPRVWVKDGNDIVPICDCTPAFLQRGDIVALSFTVTYHTTSSNWFPQFHPADIVVLRRSEGDPTDYNAPEIGLYTRPPPSFIGCEGEPSGSVATTSGVLSRGGGEESTANEDAVGGSTEVPGPFGEGQSKVDEVVGGDKPSVVGHVGSGQFGTAEHAIEGKGDDNGMKGTDGRTQEPVKAGDAEGVRRGRSSDTLDSADEARDRPGDDFEVVQPQGKDGEKMYEDYVDLAAHEVGKPANRGGAGKPTRTRRK